MVARLLFAPLLRHRSSSSTLASRLLSISQISTLVVAEHEGGLIRPASLSALAAAGSIGHDNSISVLLAGTGSSLHTAASQAAGLPTVSQVLVADSEFFERPIAEPLAELVHTVHKRGKYSHIVTASNSFGKNMLPRAAALLDVSPVTDVIEIHEPQLFIRPIYAGNALCTVRYTGSDPCMLSIRPTSFSPISAPIDQKPHSSPISQVDLSTFSEGATKKSKWLNHTSQDAERPDLVNARVVVTGGRGLKSAENFKLLEKLAEKLGAAVGATRAAVDANFVLNDLQVGQTGKIVAPDLYMAFGVSGAIQHLAGMRDSKVIVAVNKDADAPIFQIADYGLVADLFHVIPELLEKLPEKK